MTTYKPYWHIHHKDFLLEWSDDIQERIDFIQAEKPKHEVEIRLRLLKPVQGALPPKLVKAGDARGKAEDANAKAWDAHVKAGAPRDKAKAAYDKAKAAYDKDWDAFGKDWDAYRKAYDKYLPQIEALHALECPDCPWDGFTIFPE